MLFLSAFVVGAASLRRVPSGRRGRYAAIPVLGLLGFLDEMSFGAAELGFTPPRVHDILLIAEVLIQRDPGSLLVLAAIAVIGLGILIVHTRHRFLIPAISAIRSSLPWRFTAISAVFVTMALVLDITRIDSNPRRTAEEVFEMNGGLALLFAALAMAGVGPREAAVSSEQSKEASINPPEVYLADALGRSARGVMATGSGGTRRRSKS